MIDLYTFATSNGQRAAIILAECDLPYRVHRIDLMKGEQTTSDFLKLNPAGAIPVIVDPTGPGGKPITLAQSGAIAIYAAEKSGRFLAREGSARIEALQWLMFAVTDCASATGMIFFELVLLPDKTAANAAFANERMKRFFRVADQRLAEREWLAGELSIADFALYPVTVVRKNVFEAGELPHLGRWMQALAARPAVARGMTAVA